MVHGEAAAAGAEAASAVLFGSDPSGATASTLEAVAEEVPTTSLGVERIADGLPLLDLVHDTGLASSRSEAGRVLDQGGVSVNGGRAGRDRTVGLDDLLHGRFVLLRRGKDQYHLVVATPGGAALPGDEKAG
jgi:tyrosyl-tRNA synthetase